MNKIIKNNPIQTHIISAKFFQINSFISFNIHNNNYYNQIPIELH